MKKYIPLILFAIQTIGACSKSNSSSGDDDQNPGNPDRGTVIGRVLTQQGIPVRNARVFISNDLYYNVGLQTSTNDNGNYQIAVPEGSWRAYAQMDVMYEGRLFQRLDLAPENTNSFSTDSAAVRNFTWKLTGTKPAPLAGYFGGLIALYNDPNCEIWDVENIEFTLTPLAPLIDGSTGETLKLRSGVPGSDHFKLLKDVPIGKYKVTATHLPSGKKLKLAPHNNQENFGDSITLYFEPELNFCTNCSVIVFTDRE